jgi:hypothetical protein
MDSLGERGTLAHRRNLIRITLINHTNGRVI